MHAVENTNDERPQPALAMIEGEGRNPSIRSRLSPEVRREIARQCRAEGTPPPAWFTRVRLRSV
jgi:hypothetical protein